MTEIGQQLELEILSVAYGGDGLAREDNLVVFVPGVAPGERVLAEIVETHKSFARARLVKILRRAAERIEPVCPLVPDCPGCAYQHLAYGAEVNIKQAQLAELLQRLGGVSEPNLDEPVAAPQPLGYRNKIVLHASRRRPYQLGYFGHDNRTILDVEHCPLAQAGIDAKIGRLRNDEGFMGSLRPGMEVTIRATEHDGVLFWKGSPRGTGQRLFEQTVLGKLRVPKTSFFQVNPSVADLLIEEVMRLLPALDISYLVDLYCGVGGFTIAGARAGVPYCLGVDADEEAVRAAHRNAVKLEVEGLEFVAAPVRRVLQEALDPIPMEQSAVLMDPPRRGMKRAELETLAAAGPAHIIYISCSADTLSRDIKLLTQNGYQLVKARLFDMFPRTSSFETLTLLRKVQRGQVDVGLRTASVPE